MHEGKTIEQLGAAVDRATADMPKEYFVAQLHKAFADTERDVHGAMLSGSTPAKETALRETLSTRGAAPKMLAALNEIGCIARVLALALDGESKATDDSLAEIRKLCQDAVAEAEGRA